MKKALAFLLAVSMMMSLSACGNTSTPGAEESASPAAEESTAPAAEQSTTPAAEESNEPKSLTVGTMDTTDTFDPCVASSCRLGLMLVYDTVLKLNYDTQDVEACIATDWNWVNDTTLELTIRDGVYFSNGDLLTPDDVLYSLSRFVYENDQFDPGYDNINFDACTVDGNKLTIVLNEIDADFLANLANDQWASVVDESYVTENPDSWWDAPVGSGPYICLENVEGSHSSYERRDDYWGELPSASTVTVQHYTESTTMIADFENGVLDMVLAAEETDYLAAVAGDYGSDVQTKLFPTYDIISVQLPEYNPIFDDINVRKAIAEAIDYEAFANAVFGSLGSASDSFMISTMKYYAPQGIIEYNPEDAKQLLADAGYGDGLEMKLVIPQTPSNERAATILQSFLADVGITLNVESYDFATAIPILMANGTDISIGGTGGGTYLASQLLDTISMYNTNGAASIKDPEFNAHLDAALATLDEDVRAEEYAAAQEWLFNNYRTLPIGSSEAAVLYHGNISNVTGLVARTIDLEAVVVS